MTTTTKRARVAVTDYAEQRARVHERREAAIRRGDDAAIDQADAELEQVDKAEQRSAERADLHRRDQAREQEALRAREEQAKRDRVDAIIAEVRGKVAHVQRGWDAQRVIVAGTLAEVATLYRAHYALTTQRSSLLVGDRIQEWVLIRMGEMLPGGAATPYLVERYRRKLTLAQCLGLDPVPTAPSQEA